MPWITPRVPLMWQKAECLGHPFPLFPAPLMMVHSPSLGSLACIGRLNGSGSTRCVCDLHWHLIGMSLPVFSFLFFNFDGQFPPLEGKGTQSDKLCSFPVSSLQTQGDLPPRDSARSDVFGHQHTYEVIYVVKSQQSRVHVSYKFLTVPSPHWLTFELCCFCLITQLSWLKLVHTESQPSKGFLLLGTQSCATTPAKW